MKKFKDIEDLKSQIETNQTLRDEFLKDPKEFISQTATNPLIDKSIFKWIIFIIGGVLFFCIIASTVFIFQNTKLEVPTFLVTIGSTSLGALVGLLTATP